MTPRKYPIIPGEVYHVYNRSIAGESIFQKYYNTKRFLSLLKYYQYKNPPLRYSFYIQLNQEARKLADERLISNHKMVQILAYCLMPNHYHLVIREIISRGISTFLSLVQNGYAKYYNLKTKRSGSLFLEMFKAKRIEDDSQLIHTVRYVHLNPYSSCVIKEIDQLKIYPYSSYSSYINDKNDGLTDCSEMIALHNGINKMIKSTLEQADYQRSLKINENELFV